MNLVDNYFFADSQSKLVRRKPFNIAAMLELADQMSHSTRSKFTYGLAYQLNDYTADGTIFDYMSGVRKVRTLQVKQSSTLRQQNLFFFQASLETTIKNFCFIYNTVYIEKS